MSTLLANLPWLFGYGPRVNFVCHQERMSDRAFIDEYFDSPNSKKPEHAGYSAYLRDTEYPLTHEDYRKMYRIMEEKQDGQSA